MAMGLALSLVGGLLLLVSLSGLWETLRLVSKGRSAEGVVITLKDEGQLEGKTMFRPVIRFQDAAGKTHEVESSIRANPPTHAVGQRVRVYYSSHHPEAARIGGGWEMIGIPLGLLIFGGMFLAAGVQLLLPR